MCRGEEGRRKGGRRRGGRAGRGERGSGGAEAAQTVPGPALPGALPSPFQCGVPLARARTGTAHAPQILNLHWRRPPWQPHMRAGRPGGRGRARRGRWEAGGSRTSERLSLAPAHARLAGVWRVRKGSEALGNPRKCSEALEPRTRAGAERGCAAPPEEAGGPGCTDRGTRLMSKGRLCYFSF